MRGVSISLRGGDGRRRRVCPVDPGGGQFRHAAQGRRSEHADQWRTEREDDQLAGVGSAFAFRRSGNHEFNLLGAGAGRANDDQRDDDHRNGCGTGG